MGAALLIMVREGFEGALVVAIVLAYLRKTGRRDLFGPVWLGVAAAVGVSIAIGVGIHVLIGEFTDPAEARVEAAVAAIAVGVLTWMVFWMQRQSRAIKGELEHKIDTALSSHSVAQGLVFLAFVSVVREGFESALFLVNAATSASGADVFIGGLIGTAIAAVLGVLVYQGGHRIPMRQFFTVTGMIVIVFAAGLCAKVVMELQISGDLGSMWSPMFDLSSHRWLTDHSEFGRFLVTLFGWHEDARPSFEQVVVWFGYLVPVATLFLRGRTPRATGEPGVSSASRGSLVHS
ncbi:MAG TPA: FTR1 family protein [Acidimicrobiia bacterium]|nr:FTR1 family protein [Acidimicrobiia bacterium]